MYCRNCGSQMEDIASVCVKCGVKKGNGVSFCPNCGSKTEPNAAYCTNCGVDFNVASGEQKSKLVAVLLAFFLGGIGIHDFYLGYTKYGIIKIILTVCTGVGGGIWALIDFIRLLTGSLHTDANGVELKKEF